MAQFPNPDTQFKPGQSGNPGGKTASHRAAEVKAAELAAKVQLDLVQALANAVSECDGDVGRLEYLTKEVNALLKNAQDRGFGAPVQPQEITSPDGSAGPSVIRIVAAPARATPEGHEGPG